MSSQTPDEILEEQTPLNTERTVEKPVENEDQLPTEPPVRDIHAQIKWAAEEANILLEYTIHKGIDISDETMAAIISAKYIQEWDAEKESAFWKAYREISIAVRPATVSSIKAGKRFYGKRASFLLKMLTGNWQDQNIADSRLAVLRYRAVAIVILLMIIVAQIYSFTGSELTRENKNLQANFDSLLFKSWQLQANVTEQSADSSKYWQLYYDLGKSQTILESNFNYMIGWHRWWTRTITLGLYTPNIERDTVAIVDVGWAPQDDSFNRYRPLARMAYSVGFPLQVVNMYLLPLLYGMMGACAYVLREISEEVQNMTYSNDDAVNYNLRIQLGALSGLIVGWFLTPVGGINGGEIFSVYNLGPFALSFLSGYSIELVFSAMDRFIAAFSNKTANNVNT
ncbi:hypothetical protein [Rhodoflexus sp.]